MTTDHPAAPSQRPGPQRRGTVLLMVIGVLALLAIIAVVYATLGRSDRATSAALVRERRIEDRSAEIARYLQDAIGAGVFATIPQRAENGAAVLKRKAHDFPWTDPNMLSAGTANAADLSATIANLGLQPLPALYAGAAGAAVPLDPFRPSGSVRRSWPSAVEVDLRDFGTPFLSATQPTFLSFLTAGSGTAVNVALSPNDPLANRRDWSNISVISPSGNFVNLANLRNNWNAEPGWGVQYTLPNGTDRYRMSTGLTLFQGGGTADAGKSYDLGRPGNLLNVNQPVPIRVGQAPRDAHPLRPADWATNQIWAFRPMIDAEFDPGQYAYLPNQWADADGDGFADSRWTELVDISASFGTNPLPPQSVLPSDGRVRYFIAARVVDASALINVNTASDMVRTPGQLSFATKYDRDRVYLPGASPADIDLRRVLMRLDFDYDYHQYLTQAPRQGPGYLNIPRPESDGDIGDYSSYDALTSLRLGSSGYMALQSFLLRGSTLVSQTGITTTPLGNVGGVADENVNPINTNGLRAGPVRRFWSPPGAETTGPVLSEPGLDYRGSTLTPKFADLRLQSYSLLASRSTRQYDPGFPGGFGSGTAPIFGSAFGQDDELDLRKFLGLNDSSSSSVLESVVGGRASGLPSLSPLRDGRLLSLETQGREFGGDRPYRHLFGPPADEQPVAPDGVSARRDQVLVGYFGDIRQLLTTHSGARPIVESVVRTPAANADAGPLADADLATDLTRPLTLLRAGGPRAVSQLGGFNDTDRLEALSSVVDVYMRSLLPFGSSDTIGTSNAAAYPTLWPDLVANPTGNEGPWVQAAGLAWGGRAEIAARTSVHLALNLADALDVDRTSLFAASTYAPRPLREIQPEDTHEPTAVSVFMYAERDAGTPDELLDFVGTDPRGRNLRDYFAFPRIYLPERIAPLVANRTAIIDNRVAGPRALNMYGVEPQPFLIEATSIFLYTDAPSQAGGDVEPPIPSPIPGDPDVPGPVTVDLDARLSNSDFMGEAFAIQITNPFDDPLPIYRDAPTTGPWFGSPEAEVRFYVQIGERYFLLAEQEADSYTISSRQITLAPGETRVFYALNPGTRNQFKDRIRAVANARAGNDDLEVLDPAGAGGDDWFTRNFLDRQFGPGAIQMPMIDPESLRPVGGLTVPGENATITGALTQSEFMDLWSLNTLNGVDPAYAGTIDPAQAGVRRVVSLYRVMRSTVGPLFSFIGDLNNNNDPYNDYLVDRLRDPTGSSAGDDGELFGRRPSGSRAGSQEIPGTSAGPDTTGGTPQDNTGFTMIFWGTVRRPTAEGFIDTSTGRPRLGVLPPWCIENKSDNDPIYGATPATGRRAKWSLNATDKVADDTVGSSSDYSSTGTPRERFRSVRRMLGLPDNAGNPPPVRPGPVNTELPKDAYAKSGNPIPFNFDGRLTGTPARRPYLEVAPEYHTVGFDPFAPDANGTARRSSRNAGLFSRVGDLLLPLGVGPWMDPVVIAGDPSRGSPSNPDVNSWNGGDERLLTPEFRWTSLAEALALATGYYSPAEGAGGVPARNLYANFGAQSDVAGLPFTANLGPRFDRGHLRLDAFTPYRLLANGVPTGNERREPIGAGIPFALNILSNARIAYGVGTTLDDNGATPTFLSRQSAAGSGTEATPGLLNINTAVRETLSAVPLLRPPPDVRVLSPGATAANIPPDWTSVELTARELGFFGAATPLQPATPRLFETAPLGTTPPAVPGSGPLGITNRLRDYDIATTFVAYRDKSAVLARPFTAAAAPGRTVDFSIEHIPASTTLPLPARAENANLPGLREGLGFRSVGEIMAASYYRPPGVNAGYWPAVSIDRMGDINTPGRQHPSLQASRFYPRDATGRIDTVNFARPDILEPARSGIPPATPPTTGTPLQGTLPLVNADVPTYASKLAIATAALGTISVRSDVFVVYFLVHGYTPEDVIVNDDPGVGPVEPMTPSIAKRFVMVLDRSNVVNPGDTPQVLMLQEVPLTR